MVVILGFLALFGVLLAHLVRESFSHRSRLSSVPIRVHVNGTRGKSSVTRLIAAGLRGGGKRVCAKTTGTTARMILPDGRELPVFRPAGANVREQIRVLRVASAFEAEILVVECMALQPELQWLSERWFVQATHGVITNARPDHLDVMGPGPEDVALALCGMVPRGGKLYTCEQDHLHVLDACCKDRGSELLPVDAAAVADVTEEDLAGFLHREHPDNVALALRICADLGVSREDALAGMWAGRPDPGALSEHDIDFFGRRMFFFNGFAANDPVSSEMIWRYALGRHPGVRRIALVNCRDDRADRSRQLAEAMSTWTEMERIVLCGTGTTIYARAAARMGLSPTRLVTAEGAGVDRIFELVVEQVDEAAVIVGLGNIGGPGLELVRLFRYRGRPRKVGASPAQEEEPSRG